MKRICIFLIILLSGFMLAASTTDVFKSTAEIQAYKKLVFTDSLVDDDIPAEVTFKILDVNDTEVANGGSTYSQPVSTNNQSFTAFKWEMTGNQYYAVNVSFRLSPLYSGTLDAAGNLNASDAREIIPYTITFANSATSVSYRRSNSDYNYKIEDTKLTSNNLGNKYAQVTADGTTYRVYFADSKTFTDSVSSALITTSAKTIGLALDLSVNSYCCRNNNQGTQIPAPQITSCGATWTRSGTATAQLNLNSDKSSWTDTSGGNPVTYLLSSGEHTYTALIVVEISTD